jgi:hypothetical protein
MPTVPVGQISQVCFAYMAERSVTMNVRKVSLVCALLLAFAATTARAELLTGISTTTAVATASSQFNPGATAMGCAQNAINGSGLTWDAGYTSGSCSNSGDWATIWFSDNVQNSYGANQWLKIDLGKSYVLDSLVLYNNNDSASYRGIQNGAIYLSNSATDPGNPLDNATNWTSAFGGPFAQASGTADYTGDAISGVSGQTARYVSILVTSTFSPNWWDGIVGINEVAISGHEVPEPGTLALLAGGLLGLIAYAWRKRK